MLNIFRAFGWLRWRVLVNSFERTGTRDRLARFSIAIDKLGSVLALTLLIPSAMGLAAIAGVAGYGAAAGDGGIALQVIRYALLAAVAFTIVGPMVLPLRSGTDSTRFLLLPIPRGILYAAHVAGALADPWILLVLPIVLFLPAGLAIGGRPGAAVVTFVAGALLVALLTGLTSLASSTIHLLLRNRRRGDIVMLVVVLVFPLIMMLPAVYQSDRLVNAHSRSARHQPAEVPGWVRRAAGIVPYAPSELFYRSVPVEGERRSAVPPWWWLGLCAAAVQGLGFVAFRRLLSMPVSMGTRRAGALGGLWGRTIPGLSAAASGIAFTQLRLAVRTPRGRSVLAGPLLIFAVFAVVMHRSGQTRFAGVTLSSGLNLATFGCVFALLSITPLALNQFAIDRGGLTRYLLEPIGLGELLAGKAVGNALIAALPAGVCLVISAVFFPGGSPALWTALVLSLIATYVLLTPIAAALSAIFPREVNLNSIGNASNAHQAATLLGLLAMTLLAGPSVLITLVSTLYLHRPALAPLLLAGWTLVAAGVAVMLFGPVRRLLARRMESIVLGLESQ